jgi:ADP-ribose pyrophosphatase YjhB (NUDIX family)
MSAPPSRFCSQCGGALVERFVPSEQRARRLCAQCGEIAYCNPKVLVTTIVASGEQVLLVRRAAPPAAGRWALPGGFMEGGETMEEAAARETREETGVQLDPRELRLYGVAMLPQISEIYVGFLATIAGPTNLVFSSESLEVGFFCEADLPWSELAYADIGVYLRQYFSERREGAHVIHYGCIEDARVVSKVYRIADVGDDSRSRTPTADWG